MDRTAPWKQLAAAAAMIAAAALAWHFRAELDAMWASLGARSEQSVTRSDRAPGVPVIVDGVRRVEDDLTFSAIGTGFAQRSVTLRAPSGGQIMQLDIVPGRKYAAGDLLMRLEDTDERLAVQLAEARFRRASSERDRYRALQDTGAAATARIEQAETDYQVARIELEKARAELDDRTLRAPFDGVAGLASVETGDRIAADEAISSFDDRSRILVEFDLPEALLGRVAPGLAVTARTPAVEGRAFEGAVTAIDSRVDAASRTARVRAAIDNTTDELRPGASFALQLDLPGKTYPAVPELALQFSRGALHVWRVADGAAEQVEVRLVRRRAGLVIVDGPLDADDRVIVEGTQRLRPGRAVEVLNTPGTGPS
ncbi:efflux RND transporter periplasmic adaptor subunit [Roseovarius salis]|uniref:efflux RND transporter periplasmic adaptor subunit n=1 Tax=Roseovarius salis TaxID=3376063 RepID=UPI0037C90846